MTPDEVAARIVRVEAPDGQPATLLVDLGGPYRFALFHGPAREAEAHRGRLVARLAETLSAGGPSPPPADAGGAVVPDAPDKPPDSGT